MLLMRHVHYCLGDTVHGLDASERIFVKEALKAPSELPPRNVLHLYENMHVSLSGVDETPAYSASPSHPLGHHSLGQAVHL